jgi:3',5'-cyclic AMP phosphodiesterase CpdA
MRRIVHLSDVHFGRVDEHTVERAIESINGLEPDVVVVSGDLTQRAKTVEFKAAREFLDRLPKPQIVVPGNHDIPLYNVIDRFARPLDKFRKYITDELMPKYVDGQLAVLGVNTARSNVVKGGRINAEQIDAIKQVMCQVKDFALKVVATHHPFDLPEGHNERDIVGRARMAISKIAECGADVFLAGHLHITHIGNTAKRYDLKNGRAALVVQAGTATSVRSRGEAQSFNVLDFEHPRLTIKRMEFRSIESGFEPAEQFHYEQSLNGWNRTFV